MIGSESGPIPGVDFYDTDLLGASKAMEKIIMKANGGPVKVLLDNPNAARAIQIGRSKLSQAVVDKFTTLAGRLLSVEVPWIPGHSGIIRNEQADKLAKVALRDLPDLKVEQKYTFAALNQLVLEQAEDAAES